MAWPGSNCMLYSIFGLMHMHDVLRQTNQSNLGFNSLCTPQSHQRQLHWAQRHRTEEGHLLRRRIPIQHGMSRFITPLSLYHCGCHHLEIPLQHGNDGLKTQTSECWAQTSTVDRRWVKRAMCVNFRWKHKKKCDKTINRVWNTP